MKIGVFGTSNEILQNGWVNTFVAACENTTVKNFSVGDSFSPLALYQFEFNNNIDDLDLAILSFCVNDMHGLTSGLLNENIHKMYIKHIISRLHSLSIIPVVILLPDASRIVTGSASDRNWRSIGHELGAIVIDFFLIFNELGLANDFDLKSLYPANDVSHINSTNAIFVGQLIASVINIIRMIGLDRIKKNIKMVDYSYPFNILNAEKLSNEFIRRENSFCSSLLAVLDKNSCVRLDGYLHGFMVNRATKSSVRIYNDDINIIKDCSSRYARKVDLLMGFVTLLNPIVLAGSNTTYLISDTLYNVNENTVSGESEIVGNDNPCVEIEGLLVSKTDWLSSSFDIKIIDFDLIATIDKELMRSIDASKKFYSSGFVFCNKLATERFDNAHTFQYEISKNALLTAFDIQRKCVTNGYFTLDVSLASKIHEESIELEIHDQLLLKNIKILQESSFAPDFILDKIFSLSSDELSSYMSFIINENRTPSSLTISIESVNHLKSYSHLKGWVAINKHVSTDGMQIVIFVKRKSGDKLIFPAKRKRTDLTRYFNHQWNLDDSGFEIITDRVFEEDSFFLVVIKDEVMYWQKHCLHN